MSTGKAAYRPGRGWWECIARAKSDIYDCFVLKWGLIGWPLFSVSLHGSWAPGARLESPVLWSASTPCCQYRTSLHKRTIRSESKHLSVYHEVIAKNQLHCCRPPLSVTMESMACTINKLRKRPKWTHAVVFGPNARRGNRTIYWLHTLEFA